MTLQQRKLIINPFAISHFSYCPIVLIFHSRQLNNGINNIHERALQIIYQDYTTSFTDLLAKDNSSKLKANLLVWGAMSLVCRDLLEAIF